MMMMMMTVMMLEQPRRRRSRRIGSDSKNELREYVSDLVQSTSVATLSHTDTLTGNLTATQRACFTQAPRTLLRSIPLLIHCTALNLAPPSHPDVYGTPCLSKLNVV